MADVAEQFNFELVAPDRKVISEAAWQVTIPGEEGDVGVRAGHMALVMSVRPGVVEVIRQSGGAVEKLFVAGGFADITQTQCTLLAEETIPLASLSVDKLEQELKNLADDMTLAGTDADKARIRSRQDLVIAMLRAVRG
jgi:F-type H+-transporting ATPase subunit epsilon